MYILGISSNVHISSAALIKDGIIVAAVPEERFTREKRTRRMPVKSIKFCLQHEGIKLEDVDYIAVANDPGITLTKYNRSQSEVLRWYPEIIYQIPNCLSLIADASYEGPMKLSYTLGDSSCNIHYISHHKCHMSNAFYLSGYEKAAIFTADGQGEDGTTVFAVGNNTEIKQLNCIEMPYSLGLFYGTFTEFLGYHRDSDEWKVMGMAAYADWNNEYYQFINSLFQYEPDGRFTYDLSYFAYMYSNEMYSQRLIEQLGNPRKPEEQLTERHFKIAAALQKVIENVVFFMLNKLYEQTKMDNLVLGGGVFMNSLLNGQVKKNTKFKNVFISSCPDDSGISIGAALYLYHAILGKKCSHIQQSTNYYGPDCDNKYVESILKRFKLPIKFYSNQQLYEHSAQLLSEEKVIAWVQGRMEFGQRALGNRSILADPRKSDMKERLNKSIKYREYYRPIAPVVIDEDFNRYFVGAGKAETSFMSMAIQTTSECKNNAPAIVHNDGTSRVQVVEESKNERLYQLLKAFKAKTGIGILVNTSFNVAGEPVVCSIEDAIRTFYSSGIDVLVVGNYIIEKSGD